MALYEFVMEKFFTGMSHLMNKVQRKEYSIRMASGRCDGSGLLTPEVLKKQEVIQQLKEWEEQK